MRLMEPAIIPEYVKKYFPPDQRREVSLITTHYYIVHLFKMLEIIIIEILISDYANR